MKKICRLISAVLLFSMLISAAISLSSCGKIGAASTVLKISDNMNALDSYRANTRVSMSYYVDNSRITSVSESTLIEAGINDPESYFFYRDTVSTVESENLGISTSFSQMEAYDGETYYIKSTNGDKSNKISGPMTKDEFFELQGGFNVALSGAKKIKETKNSDGSGKIECSGFSRKVLTSITASLGIGSGELGEDVSDLKIYIDYDKELRIKKIDYLFVFAVSKNQKKYPSLRIIYEYSDYNSAQDNPRLVAPAGYDCYEDLKMFFKIEELVEEKINDKNGKFESYTSQSASVGLVKTSFKQKDTVRYGKKWSGYYFNIKMDINDVKFAMQYKNGKLKTKGAGVSESEEISDGSAKSYIASLIDNAKLNLINLKSIEEVEDGVYFITYNVIDTSEYVAIIKPYGGQLSKCEHTATVTLNSKGELETVESFIKVSGSGTVSAKTINKFN